MCRVYASQRTRTRNVKRRKAGEGKKEEKRNASIPVYHTHTRPHPCALANVERLLTLHFVVGVFYASYCLSFSTPFQPTARPRPTYTSPFLTLDAPGKKNRLFFALLFLRYMPPSAIFEALFPGTVYPPLFTMQIKAGPSPLFLWRNPAPCRSISDSENRIVKLSTSMHPNETLRSPIQENLFEEQRSLKMLRFLGGI